jgi:broad specificity phosphatase PhoE
VTVGLPCRVVLTGPERGAVAARSCAELLDIALEHQGSTVHVGAPSSAADAFLAHVVGFDALARPGLAVRGGFRTVADVGADGRGVIRSLNGDAPLPKLVEDGDSGPDACRLVLARHGQSMAVERGEPVYSHHPVGLTGLGREQARRLAAALAPVPLDAVYTSDLNRARETAGPVAAAQGLEPIVVPQLREISLGDLEGQTLATVRAERAPFIPWLEVAFNGRFPSREFHHPADLVFPGGESVVAVWERVRQAFLDIVGRHPGGTIAVIAHGWVLQPLLCHVIAAPTADYFRLQLPYATPTLVEVGREGRGTLAVLNGFVEGGDAP